MTITPIPTLDQVLTLATRLPPADKLRLIERLAPQIAQVLPMQASVVDESLAELDALIAESATIDPAERDSADVLSEMRR
ncbi:hypothetical protein [Candidatus Oscillochloris fontis]|uniref:hypothetical protein n=1 Tax=Candidatus Oscillochloris fontis TaxID=2496868 RepID=UPI00101D53FA|nr:hypothetical protein [Candidatus Oscillochloris fontis]